MSGEHLEKNVVAEVSLRTASQISVRMLLYSLYWNLYVAFIALCDQEKFHSMKKLSVFRILLCQASYWKQTFRTAEW